MNLRKNFIFLVSRFVPSFLPIFELISTKLFISDPLQLSSLIIIIALQTQFALIISANRDEKLFVESKDSSQTDSLIIEICKRIFYSIIIGLPVSIFISIFIKWNISFHSLYFLIIFSVYKSLDKLIALCKFNYLVVFNNIVSFVTFIVIIYLTKNIVLACIFISAQKIIIYAISLTKLKKLKSFLRTNFFKKLIFETYIDLTIFGQNFIRASSLIVFLTTRLDQIALANLAVTGNPIVISYFTFKKFIDLSGYFFTVFYSKDTKEKMNTYSRKELINVYASQLIEYSLLMIFITLILSFTTIYFYGIKATLLIFIVTFSASLNCWGSQKGPAYTRLRIQNKNFIFLLVSFILVIPIYFIFGFTLKTTIISALLTGVLVNLILPIYFIDFDRKVLFETYRKIFK